mmetsp:Transcript_47721/g.126235  ORF Transcript_47721/g.126235 Transcript_47721/m.126235 type:complete len:102 (-) Transcript_47721:2641-2946(-)
MILRHSNIVVQSSHRATAPTQKSIAPAGAIKIPCKSAKKKRCAMRQIQMIEYLRIVHSQKTHVTASRRLEEIGKRRTTMAFHYLVNQVMTYHTAERRSSAN